MVKKARFTNVFRTIKGSLNRFLAITAIVALGAGFLGGLQATTPDMKDAADAYMDKYNWFDIDVVNQLGFTQEQIDAITLVEGVQAIQKGIVYDEVFENAQKKRSTMRVFGLLVEGEENPLEMNGVKFVKGDYPKAADECLIQVTSVYSSTLPEIGEEIKVLEGGGNSFNYKTLKVAGVVQGPMFFSAELEPSLKGSGFLDMALYVRQDFFVFENINHVYITVKGAKELDTWSKEYKDLISSTKTKISLAIEPLVSNQFNELLDFASSIDKVTAKAEAADLSLQRAAKNQLVKHEEVISYLSKNGGSSSFVDALKNETQLLKTSERKPVHYDVDMASVSKLIDKAKSYKSNIFSIEDRSKNAGYSGYKDNIEKISSLSKVFPVFFFFIALLVSLTTMTRLVEEKRTEIGTLKSLGFSSFQLLSQYLFYALLSSLLGCIIGLAIGFKIFPTAVSLAYSMLYSVPLGKMPFRWNIALPVSLIAIGVIMFATACACISETLARPAVLMAPKAPAPGKRILLERITFIWNKISFSRKVTIRNMFRYKRRLWMTIAGISGCSALLVAGFGLRDSLQDIMNIQFEQIDTYNLSVLMSNPEAYKKDLVLRNFLEDKSKVTDWIKFSSESAIVINGEKSLPVTMYVPEDTEKMKDFMKLRTRKGHKSILLDEEGIVINEKQTELLGVKAGDFVTVESGEGISRSVKVIAAAENYLYGNIYLSQDYYEELFNKSPVYNLALCKLADKNNNKETVASLMESPNVLYAMWIDGLLDNAHKTIDSINIVVFVIILTSGLLSLIVLYNLSNINICERKREIATLLVLGYTETEARKYIFREINVLSILGTLVGLLLGGPLHSIVVHATEVNIVMWGRSVHPASYAYALVVSILFTLFVNLLMKKSITSIDMVESLKAKD